MSVRESERTEGKLCVIIKAEELCIYTIRITHNEKVFPKRYRFSITEKLQMQTIEILTLLTEANEMYPKTASEKEERLLLQKRACAKLRSLQTMIRISKDLFGLSMDKVKYWSQLATEVRNKTVAWYNADSERFKL
jgi:hypothetical protein